MSLNSMCIVGVLVIWWIITVGDGDHRLVDAYTLPSPAATFGPVFRLRVQPLVRCFSRSRGLRAFERGKLGPLKVFRELIEQ